MERKYFVAYIYDADSKKLILTSSEETQYVNGEIFTPIEKQDYVCVFASEVSDEKQFVVAMKLK